MAISRQDTRMEASNMEPPPAPRKELIRKMIRISSRVRRRINFDLIEQEVEPCKKRKLSPEDEDEEKGETPCTPTNEGGNGGSRYNFILSSPPLRFTSRIQQTSSVQNRVARDCLPEYRSFRTIDMIDKDLHSDSNVELTPPKSDCSPVDPEKGGSQDSELKFFTSPNGFVSVLHPDGKFRDSAWTPPLPVSRKRKSSDS